MTAFYQQIYRMVVSGTAPSAVFTDLQSLKAANGAFLGDLLSLYRETVKLRDPKPDGAVQKMAKIVVAKRVAPRVQDPAPVPVRLAGAGLRIGDVVRSQEHYWKRTQRDVTGAIVRFERVPDEQIHFVGSDHWVYLNSGEGPVSLAVVEKVPETSLESCDEPDSIANAMSVSLKPFFHVAVMRQTSRGL